MKKLNLAIGSVLCSIWLLMTLISLIYTPYDPLFMHLDSRLSAPNPEFLLGTDQYGRDLLSRLLAASSVSFIVCASTTLIAIIIGGAIGAMAGYKSGIFDRLVVMVLDAVMAFPPLLLVLLFLSVAGPSLPSIIIALAIAYIPTAARVMRSAVLSIREKEYVEACLVLGQPTFTILGKHILPNTLSPMIVLATSMFATVLLIESALSFLGLGVAPPAATWGGLLADSRQYLGVAPWLSIVPGVVISLTLLGISMLGDALRDVLDPKV
ncbi:ABC transporter permease [Alteromonas oceanisediminis]|uniref:ABC transporter permease n=1 Tax=Alteromonas oceanisediminis TaxID=2836180 RepID=UPI001BD9C03E|nr:ABC transporter permease [Alteromonas oceanisediminis]MBT0585172.1 ABC transporter permease [Alteromonas oceanisediminis]